jgi:hypothetical protein
LNRAEIGALIDISVALLAGVVDRTVGGGPISDIPELFLHPFALIKKAMIRVFPSIMERRLKP